MHKNINENSIYQYMYNHIIDAILTGTREVRFTYEEICKVVHISLQDFKDYCLDLLDAFWSLFVEVNQEQNNVSKWSMYMKLGTRGELEVA